MKQYLELIKVIVIGWGLYFGSIKLLSIFFDSSIKENISWGISIYYSYYVYAFILFFSVLAWNTKRHIIYLTVTSLLAIGFIYYWIGAYGAYPNRTIAIITLGIVILGSIHFYLSKKKLKLRGS